MNGGDKLVKGLSDNEAIVESTVNILISDVVVTEGGSGVVVIAVGVISGSKLLSVIRFITLLVERLVMDTTSDGVIKDGALDGISVNSDNNVTVVAMVTVSDDDNGVLKFRAALDDSITGIVIGTVSVGVIDGREVSMFLGDVGRVETSITESIGTPGDCRELMNVAKVGVIANNVSAVSKLLRILLDIISVDCITVGTITLVILMSAGSDIVDEGVIIVVKLPIVTTSVDSVNGIIELVTG